ncbi:PTS sugar transporter subunit IIA [Vibrio sp. S11_S32]|uniref:PTS galactosamine/N-acetylgalactosamine transporter subunit IIA n=1 Tax=Vibrio sp. S11_S32 TaxID=2720225 RepID=UPI001680BE39|nr:PTS galactosamine/N-acetylgalactosamine transporter subunit IIA [Vibrio sp. S11_S32]MBD1575749.1 PTS sugar transporter subunit IIA [Vibrio sp. S11_S32]
MIAVILSGHGAFASGVAEAIRLIVGEQEQFRFVDFKEGMTTEQLEAQIRDDMADIDSNDGIVFLTDLLGGSPFRVASLIAQERTDVEVIAGTNLQMAAEMLLERDELNLVEFRQQALVCGHRGMTSLFDEMVKAADKKVEEIDDGI